jgi:hypothetical protein
VQESKTPEVTKSLIVIDHEGGHASVDREL